jgi:hypothetical protein
MSQSETDVPANWRHDPKIRFAIQILQFFVMVMLAMLVFVQKHKGEKAVVIAQQKAYQTESELNRQIYDLRQELAKTQAQIKELEKAAAK